jgi:acetyl-CoA synthetase
VLGLGGCFVNNPQRKRAGLKRRHKNLLPRESTAMADNELFPVSDAWAKRSWIDNAKYKALYQQSVSDPEGFWAEQGKRVDWIKPYAKIKDVSYAKDDLHIRWYYDGVLNVSANCIDRHLAKRGDQTAIIWEGDDPAKSAHIT